MQTKALIGVLVLAGVCGVPEDDHSAALAQIDSLKMVIDELEHGAPRLLQTVENALEKEDYRAVVATSQTLTQRHPGSGEAERAEELAAVAKAKIVEAEKQRERDAEARRREAEAEARREKQRREAALASLYKKTDQIEGTTWYYDRSNSQYPGQNRVVLYMGRSGAGRPWLRFRVSYKGSDWLFIEGFVFNVDGVNHRIEGLGFGAVERDNSGGSVWEWYDVSAGPTELGIARSIADSRQTVVRYDGKQYRRDRTISQAEKQGLQRMLDAYAALTGG